VSGIPTKTPFCCAETAVENQLKRVEKKAVLFIIPAHCGNRDGSTDQNAFLIVEYQKKKDTKEPYY